MRGEYFFVGLIFEQLFKIATPRTGPSRKLISNDLICGLLVVVKKVATGGVDAGFVVVVFASLCSILRWVLLRVFIRSRAGCY